MHGYNDRNMLFILKQDNVEDIHNSHICYNGEIILGYSDECMFDNSEIKICDNFKTKLRFLFATLHEDTKLKEIVHKFLPKVIKVDLPSERFCKGQNFIEWQKTYGFTIEEFLINKKYIVICDSIENSALNLIDLGLFKWENIAECSLDD